VERKEEGREKKKNKKVLKKMNKKKSGKKLRLIDQLSYLKCISKYNVGLAV
jgi:hypothetical protein